MKITGIIAEYNPFHMGHMYHIEETRRLYAVDKVICVMSGNFTQRGDVAVANKWQRAKMALLSGADVVIELPFLYAVQSAKYFALGGVKILNALGCIDYLSFGSEDNSISVLNQIALFEENEDFKQELKICISKGENYKSAYEKTLSRFLNISKDVFSPNNILALEYIKALNQLNSDIVPVNVLRKGGKFNDDSLYTTFSSASAIRKTLFETGISNGLLENLPLPIHELFDFIPVFNRDLFYLLLYKIRLMSLSEIKNIYDVCEGLEYKIKQSAKSAKNYDELIENIKSKRYTYTKLKRIMLYILFDITKKIVSAVNEMPMYGRILGFKKQSQDVVCEIASKSSIPIITKSSEFIKSPMLDFDLIASDIYSVLDNENSALDYTKKLIVI